MAVLIGRDTMTVAECFNKLSPNPMVHPIDLGDGRVLTIIDWQPNGTMESIESFSNSSVEVTLRGRIFSKETWDEMHLK